MQVSKKRAAENIFIGAVLLSWVLVALPPQLGMSKDLESEEPDVVFEDDFTIPFPLSKWAVLKPTENDEEDVSWVANGAYRMHSKGSLQALAPQPDTIEDAKVEVDATRIGDDASKPASWGVVCRASIAKGDVYLFALLNDGRPFIAKSDNNEVNILAVGTPAEAIHMDKSPNRIRGDCVGNKLTLYINGQKLLEVEDAEFASGGVGLAVENADISFDNFSVRKP